MAKFGSNYSALAHHYIYNNDYSECYGYRMYSENENLFSYGSHFQMARKLEVKGHKVIFVTNYTASNTTAKQMYHLRSAIPYDWKVFNVDSMYSHKVNIKDWFEQIEFNQYKYSRARSNKQYYKRTIEELVAIIVEYKELFDVKYRFNKAEQEIIDNLDIETLGELLADRSNRIRKNERAKVKRQTKKALEEAQNELVAWLEGSISRLRKQPHNSPIYLRVNEKTETVDTSEGISVPKRECKVLFDRISKGKEVRGFKLDELYSVIRLTDEVLTVGCHRIPMSEVKRVGALL